MKATALTLAILLFIAGAVHAQTSKFQIGFGHQRTWLMDRQASPLKYQTTEKTASLGYAHSGKRWKLGVQLAAAIGDFFPTGFRNRQLYDPGYNSDGSHKTDSFSLVGKLYNARLKVDFLRLVRKQHPIGGNDNLQGESYIGASINNQLFYSDNLVRAGWMNAASANVELEHSVHFYTKHLFSIRLSIPMLAITTRLPYHNSISTSSGDSDIKTFFKHGSRFAWVSNFQNIQMDAAYEYTLSKHLGLGIHYFGQWLHYDHEKPITLLQNNFGVTVSIR